MPRQIVLASHNAHKLEELRAILGEHLGGIELIGYDGPEPVEDGLSFEANALIKARAAASHTGLPAIADDSGIAVKALNGSPGIFSARWAGPKQGDQANLELLLAQLSDIADEHRAASFMCAAVLVMPGGEAFTRIGEWPGRLLREARGSEGFGYDPIFQPEGENRSAAELSSAEKNARSHRTRAFTALAPVIVEQLAD
ncbi:MAG: RdgB/HAM1 family non-canonical purine NTP pyrophosphatase [Microbacteriaceae bacterium]|nr:RdgB/HAM1 family non-canonical purine NTP pyrophosphatase [Microbacteriaceae bacterium]